ncbi:MAG: hypothetical protein H6839_04030 [Planctomycetes bacterium]|nr:hypothetical protein [Planctomycetota bacterium]
MRTVSISALFLLAAICAGTLAAQATQLVVTTTIVDTRANATIASITVEAQDGGGTLDATYNSTLSVSITTGTGTLGGTTTGVTMTSGTASFANLTIDTIGAKVLTFTDGALTDGVSNGFNITADRLIVTAQPTDTQANANISSITVEAQDGNGNTDTGYNTTINVTLSSGTGTLGGTTTGVTMTSGTSSYANLTVDTIGAKQLTFTDQAGSPLTAAVSGTFNITADRLIITTQPTATTVSTNINSGTGVVVEAQDGNGNTDTSFTGNVAVAHSAGSGTLTGTTPVAAVSGVATFSDLQIDAVGTGNELTFTNASLTTAVSSTFDITAGNSNPVLAAPSGTVGITVGGSDPSFTGTATVGGNLAVTFQATDSNGGDTLTTTVSVTGGTLSGAAAGFNESFPFAPAGTTSPHSVSLTGTAAAAGTIQLTIAVSDGNGGNDSYTLTITIATAGTPTINVTASLTAFTTTGVGVASAQQSYTVAGSNLTADITITPPTDFQISQTSGSGFATTPIVLTQTGGTVGTTTIFVRYNPTTTGPHSQVIAHTSTGATTQNVNVSGSIAGPAAVTLSASGNPGSQNANPGTTKTALGFRLAETGGGSTFTVTSVTARVTTINNTGGVAVAAISSISLRRGSTVLGTMTSASWSVGGNVITLNFTGLSSAITASSAADFTLAITFAGTSVPTPKPSYVADIAVADVNGGSSVSGTPVTGGTITLVDALPGDPLDEDKKDDSCNLATEGGPAWPMLFGGLIVAFAALRRRRRTV